MGHSRFRYEPFLALLVLLGACAPASDAERVTVAQLTEEITYYPKQTGAQWQYLPNNARVDEIRVIRTVEGPTVIDGELWIGWHLVGRGLEVRSFRQYRPEGVFLRRVVRPGNEITFSPPVQEFPPEGTLRVGSTWEGTTTALSFFPEARPENQRAELEVEYRYTVVDRREVTLAAGVFEVFVINFVTRSLAADGTVLEELVQETWFTPFVGEVRTDTGLFLVAANVIDSPREP